MPADPPLNIHATCVAVATADGWRAALLRGPSGAGKSDVALRMIDAGARLVSDDRVDLQAVHGILRASPPAALAGLVEARGAGILRLPVDAALESAAVALLVDLVPADRVERMPEPHVETLLGIAIPALRLAAFEASTPAKIRLALRGARVS
ncbi:MAG: HPr kinase/phosphatase C-terminal domain-containing protein [Rhodospirillales bacterium]|nr:HPr kinase/phosphatase C-terminal domain-containing protein [Rhodospirillales bacterium]